MKNFRVDLGALDCPDPRSFQHRRSIRSMKRLIGPHGATGTLAFFPIVALPKPLLGFAYFSAPREAALSSSIRSLPRRHHPPPSPPPLRGRVYSTVGASA